MEGPIRLLLLAPHPNEGTERGLFLDDPDLIKRAIATAHSQKPAQLLNVVAIQASLTPTDEEQMKQLFPQESPKSEPPPAQQEPLKPPQAPPPPIRSKNVDVAKEAEPKPVVV